MILPIGVEDHRVDRLPWVSIAIAALCALAFYFTWVAPSEGASEQHSMRQVISFWALHPYLQLPADLPNLERVKQLGERHPNPHAAEKPSAEMQGAEQLALDQLADDYRLAAQLNPLRGWGLVPARGWRQPGWVTYMFLHAGWMHLLGNFLFFYLVGPLLEDVWGRPLFAGFYLLGGLLAGGAQAALNPHSNVYIVGASGAIAACMGAFTFRFARRRIVMGYLFWPIARGTFKIPAWLWGLTWFGGQCLELWIGGDSNVAFSAHIGGFAFGFTVALALGASGIEAKVVAPSVAAKVFHEDPGLVRARTALAQGDAETAEREYRQLIHARPGHREAELGLARLALQRGDRPTAAAHVARALSQALSHAPDTAGEILEAMGDELHPEELPHALAFRMAGALQSAPEGWLRAQREPLLCAASAAGGALGAKALLQAAQMRLDGSSGAADAAIARGYLSRARSMDALPEELVARIDALETQLPKPADMSLPSDSPEAAGPAATPQLQQCRLLAVGVDELELSGAHGAIERLAMNSIQAIAVGVVKFAGAAGAPPAKLLVIDLVTAWGNQSAGPVARRLTSDSLSPKRFYPTLTPLQGFAEFIKSVADASGASVLPDSDAVRRGAYQGFADEAAFEAAIYGGV